MIIIFLNKNRSTEDNNTFTMGFNFLQIVSIGVHLSFSSHLLQKFEHNFHKEKKISDQITKTA